jgi:signal-transduction protein with cAMP-binding, CBS, and nucleotidyltransferase domain
MATRSFGAGTFALATMAAGSRREWDSEEGGHNASECSDAHPAVSCTVCTTVRDIAWLMSDHDVGSVVLKDDSVIGIVTDRDIVVRGAAGQSDFVPVRR